jgi:signal transduction protein with GAF and PtsI domain
MGKGGVLIMEAKELRYLKLFISVCKSINSTLNLKEVLDLITKNLVKISDVKACTVFILDRRRTKLEVGATFGLSKAYLEKGRLDADKSIADSLSGKPVMVYDVQNDPRIQYPNEARRERIFSILSVPIRVRKEVIGVLRTYTSRLHKFSDDEIEFIAGLADMGGIAMVNARMYEQLQEESQGLMHDTWEWFETMLPKPSC